MSTTEPIGPPEETRIVWGMEAIAREAGLKRTQAAYLVRTGRLTTRRIGRRHFSTPAQIHADLWANSQ